MVLLAILDIVSGAYMLAAIEIVVPGIAVGVVVLVFRREQYRSLGGSRGRRLALVARRPCCRWVADCAGRDAGDRRD